MKAVKKGITARKLLPVLLYLPAVFQMAIFFLGRDIYPFSNNEMYAGHPDSKNFQIVYLVGFDDDHKFHSRSDFLEETLTSLVDQELEKEAPDYVKVCDLIGKDMKKRNAAKRVIIENRMWDRVTKETVTKPDRVRVMHECQYL